MNNKKFKIKPKVWPKEYTFEEFKQLNPNISENLLINYYNKYLQEYAENRSRHITHFNDTKDNLSKELLVLKESIGENADGDGNVGPTGSGRKFRSPLDPIKNSIFFDRTDDHILCGVIGDLPADGTVKPYKELTVAGWVHSDPVTGLWGVGAPDQFQIASVSMNGGWRFYAYNKRIILVVSTSKTDGTKQTNTLQTKFNQLAQGKPLAHTSGPLSGSGWHYLVGTYDGRYMKVYIDGKLATGGALDGGGSYADGIGDTGHDINSTRVSGSEGAIFYDMRKSSVTGDPYRALTDFSIGAQTTVDNDDSTVENILNFWSGSIAEVAVWDKALDATTIYDIYQNNVSASQGQMGKYDLLYKGYPKADSYDLADEGITYENVGKYANNLQGWWKLDENTGTTTEDFSKNKNDGILYNSPTWSGSFAPGISI
jgi:hypothetical protein